MRAQASPRTRDRLAAIARRGYIAAEREIRSVADEPESLVLRLLQEIRADVADIKAVQAEHTAQLASIKDTQRLHGMRLDTYSENFHDIIRLLRDLATAADLRALAARVTAIEERDNRH